MVRCFKRLVVGLLGLCLTTGLGSDREAVDLEAKVKAAYLPRFAKFVSWPQGVFKDGNSPLIIGVLGDEPFGPLLDQAVDTFQRKRGHGRPIQILRCRDLSKTMGCHVLFVCSSERAMIVEIREALAGKPILTVGDSTVFLAHDVVINMVLRKNRIRFDINKRAADRAGLTINSQLLQLADRVIR